MNSDFRTFLNGGGRQTKSKDEAMTHTYNQGRCLIIATQAEYLMMLAELKKDFRKNIFHCISEFIHPSLTKPALAIYRRLPDVESVFFLFVDIDVDEGDPLSYEDHVKIGQIFVDVMNQWMSLKKSVHDKNAVVQYLVYLSQKMDARIKIPNTVSFTSKIDSALKYSNLHIQTKIEVTSDEAEIFATMFMLELEKVMPRAVQWREIVDMNCYSPQKVNLRMNLCVNWTRCGACAEMREQKKKDNDQLVPIEKSVHFQQRKPRILNTNKNINTIICPRDENCSGGYTGDTYYRVGIVMDQNKNINNQELERLRGNVIEEWLATAIRYYFTTDELQKFHTDGGDASLPLPVNYRHLHIHKPDGAPTSKMVQKTYVTATGEVIRQSIFSSESKQSQADLNRHAKEFKTNWKQLPTIEPHEAIFAAFHNFLQVVNNGAWRGINVHLIKYIEREHGKREYHITPSGYRANYCLNKTGFTHKKNTIRFMFTVLGMKQYCLHMNKTGKNRVEGLPCGEFRSDPYPLDQALQRLAFWQFQRSMEELQKMHVVDNTKQQDDDDNNNNNKKKSNMDKLLEASRIIQEQQKKQSQPRQVKPPSQYLKTQALAYLKSRSPPSATNGE